ncbi:MAG: hypothetical protein GY749_27850 [Desulfobacteraceae bacterium]|nr:hypothetical protein [Desulfobacteraceae bacterium]
MQSDPDLGRDTRIAVPILYDPVKQVVRYWATGGIRLERVVCKYDKKPIVSGPIEPVLMPTHYYLPTDIFLEFEQRTDTLLTRDEFRSICDRHKDEKTLRKELGATETKHGGYFLVYIAIIILLLTAAYKFRKKLLSMNIRRISLTIIICICVILISFPAYRTRMVVKMLAAFTHYDIDENILFIAEFKILWYLCNSRGALTGLTHLITDQNPQVRYNAARLLAYSLMRSLGHGRGEKYVHQIPELENTLRTAVNDEVVEVASYSALMLKFFKNDANTELLLSKLEYNRHLGMFCEYTLWALDESRDPKVLDTVLSFANDNRYYVRHTAIDYLSNFNDKRVVLRLTELVLSDDRLRFRKAHQALKHLLRQFPHPSWENQFNTDVLEHANNAEFSAVRRLKLAHHITADSLKAEAYLAILRSPGHGETESVLKDAVSSLSELGPEVIPGLREALKDSDPDIQKAASEALENILSNTGKKEK